MKIQLLVARWSSACERAQCLWREVADARGFALEVATGVQSKEEARALVDAIFGRGAARE